MADIRTAFQRAKQAAELQNDRGEQRQLLVEQQQWRNYNGAPNTVVACPVCSELRFASSIESHLTVCLERAVSPGDDALQVTLDRCTRRLNCSTEPHMSQVTNTVTNRALEHSVLRTLTKGPYTYRLLALSVHWCLQFERHLFSAAELDYLSAFVSLATASQWLYSWLFFRKGFSTGRWFRACSLQTRYREVDVAKASRELIQHGFLKDRPACTDDYFRLLKSLTQAEVTTLCRDLGLQSACMLKTCVAGALFQTNKQKITPARRKLEETILPAVCSCPEALQALLAAWAALAPLGLENMLRDGLELKDPLPPCLVERPLFSSRSALEAFQSARELEQSFEQMLGTSEPAALEISMTAEQRLREALKTSDEALIATRVTRYDQLCDLQRLYREPYTTVGVLANILWHSVSVAESHGHYLDAVRRLELLLNANLCLRRRGKFYDRLSLILAQRLADRAGAFRVCLDSLSDAFVRDAERSVLWKRASRLCRELGVDVRLPNDPALSIPIPERVLRGRALPGSGRRGGSVKFAGLDNTLAITVENLALQFYEAELGYTGAHLEGRTFEALFFIFFEDMLRLPVVDAFHVPCQAQPLDFGTEMFYVNRADNIRKRLLELSMLSESELSQWTREQLQRSAIESRRWTPTQAPVPWDVIVAGLGAQGLVQILTRLVTDLYYWRSGAPDLLLWRSSGKSSCKLVEVKSTNDTLAPKQRRWLQELIAAGIDVELCLVRNH
jgi:hypothetical protein